MENQNARTATESAKNERVVVTGGGRGIGKAIATKFSLSGKEVVVVDKSLNDQFAVGSGPVHFIECDLMDTSGLEDVMQSIENKFGCFDVLVNCAGIYPTMPALAISPDEWDSVITLNLKVPFLLSQLAAKQMIRNSLGGSVINVGSTAGKIARQGATHYCSSKAGLMMMSQVLALEWAEFGIRVNLVCPGVIETDSLIDTLRSPENLSQHCEKLCRIPLRRAGHPDEVASAVLFLADKESSRFITGHALYIDGGYSAGQYYSTFRNSFSVL